MIVDLSIYLKWYFHLSPRFSSQLAHLLALKIQYFCVTWRRTTPHLCSTRTVYDGNRKATTYVSRSASFLWFCKRSQKWSIYPPSLLAQFTRTLSPNGFFSVISGFFLLYLRRLHQLTLRCNNFSFFLYCQRRLTTMLMINGCVSV